jgi:heat shock protein HslJ
MKKISLITMALAIFAGLFQGCKAVKEIPVVQLSGKWVLQSFDGRATSESFKGTIPTLEFDITAKQISGTGGCNNYSGAFNLNGNEFSAPNLATTKKMCLNDNKEDAFLRLLGNTSTLSTDGEKLVFMQGGKAVLTYAKAKPLSVADLAGTWTLAWIEDASANMLFAGTLPTVEFNANESKLTGNAGCNRYNAPFTLTGNILTVKNPAATRRACGSMEGEIKFLRLLSGTVTVELDGDALSFKREGITLLQFVK